MRVPPPISDEDMIEIVVNGDGCVWTERAGESHMSLSDLRPDRIILGELRGIEAVTFLAAINTGHEGSFTTVHATSARKA